MRFLLAAQLFSFCLLSRAAPAGYNSTSAPLPLSTSTATFVFSTSTESCRTLSASTFPPSFPLPSTTTTITAPVRTTTNVPETFTSTFFVTGNTTLATATSVTSVVVATSTFLPGTQTIETIVVATTTIGTLTTTSTVCTNGITAPASTVTLFEGTYTPVSGQHTDLFASAVHCTQSRTTITSILLFVTAGPVTATFHPATTVATVTSTSSITTTIVGNPPGTTTTTISQTTFLAEKATLITSISCPETLTTTYATKCAPTNLIGSLPNGNGIEEVSPVPGTNSVFFDAGADASLCCQFCVENEAAGCGASLSSPAAFDCSLYITNSTTTSEGTCGIIFTYSDDTSDNPAQPGGTGFLLQAGCGAVQPQ